MSKQSLLLIMTDDPNQRLALSEFLGYEYQILTAQNGKEGFDFLSQYEKRVDVLITELKALSTTGLELITRKKQEYSSLQILVIKGFDTPPLSSQLEDRTVFTYIPEPFTYDELKTQIDRAIKQRKTQAAQHAAELPDIVQLYCVCQAKVALTVVRENEQGKEERGKIYFEDGNVTNAICGKMKGEEGLYYVMSWESPKFFPRYGIAVKQKAIRQDWETLLSNAHTYTFEVPVEDVPPATLLASSRQGRQGDDAQPEPAQEDLPIEVDTEEEQQDEIVQESSPDIVEQNHLSPQLQDAVSDVLEELRSQFDGMEMALVADLHGNIVSAVGSDAFQPKINPMSSLFQRTVHLSTGISRQLQLGTIKELMIMGQHQEIVMLFPIKNFGTLGVVASKGSQGMMRWNCTEAIEKIQGLVYNGNTTTG